jgi:hypothetical protein
MTDSSDNLFVAPVIDDAGEASEPLPTQLDMLKQRARLMGIPYSNNIGVEALAARIQAKLDGETVPAEPVAEAVPAAVKAAPKKTEAQIQYEEQMKLVRVRITNLNPAKKDLPGEILTVANEILGAVRKYIPYGEVTDNGYHIPFILYTELKNREFLNIKTRKDNRGRVHVETAMAREFALEVLPQLTQDELDRLASAQAAAAGLD